MFQFWAARDIGFICYYDMSFDPSRSR